MESVNILEVTAAIISGHPDNYSTEVIDFQLVAQQCRSRLKYMTY